MSNQTKEEILNSGVSISSQEALVKKILKPDIINIKRVIPGGKTMLSYLDKQTMEGAVYNWLRGVGGFSEVIISFAKDPSKFNLSISKVQPFDTRDPKPHWERSQVGRKDLAKTISGYISQKKLVYIQVKPDGIYIAEDKSNKFNAKVTLTAKLIKDTPEYEGLDVGDKVPSPDWEPYIEFVPSNRSRYTNYQK